MNKLPIVYPTDLSDKYCECVGCRLLKLRVTMDILHISLDVINSLLDNANLTMFRLTDNAKQISNLKLFLR